MSQTRCSNEVIVTTFDKFIYENIVIMMYMNCFNVQETTILRLVLIVRCTPEMLFMSLVINRIPLPY